MTKCKESRCLKKAYFDYNGGKGEYCGEHRKDDMIDVVHKRCGYTDCRKHPTFGYTRGKSEYCADHRKDDMVNVVNKRCGYIDCRKRPTFGYTRGKGEYCAEHRKDDMIDVISKQCGYTDCRKRPTFGYTRGKGEYCAEHRKDDMIDVISKRCGYTDCKKHPTFGYTRGKGEYCAEHRKDDMVNVISKRCGYTDCRKHPTFGYTFGKAERCFHHRLPTMRDTKNPRCIRCIDVVPVLEAIRISQTYKAEKLCTYHGKLAKGLDPVTRKSLQICNYVKERLSEYVDGNTEITVFEDITDPEDIDGCSKKRADILILTPHVRIFGEIDQHSHKAESYSCEEAKITEELSEELQQVSKKRKRQVLHQVREDGRMSEVSTSGVIRNTAWVRLNPDTWRDESGKINSNDSLFDRALLFARTIEEYLDIDRKWNHLVEVTHLYYDGPVRQDTFIPIDAEELKLKRQKVGVENYI